MDRRAIAPSSLCCTANHHYKEDDGTRGLSSSRVIAKKIETERKLIDSRLELGGAKRKPLTDGGKHDQESVKIEHKNRVIYKRASRDCCLLIVLAHKLANLLMCASASLPISA